MNTIQQEQYISMQQLKTNICEAEMYDLKFCSEEELRTAIAEFIRYYNKGEYPARFGFKSPSEVRTAALASAEPEQYSIPENPRIQNIKQDMRRRNSEAALRFAPVSLRIAEAPCPCGQGASANLTLAISCVYMTRADQSAMLEENRRKRRTKERKRLDFLMISQYHRR